MGGDEGEGLDRMWFLAAGFLLLMTPAVTLVIVYAVLLATQSVVLGRITPLQWIEIYLVELIAFALFGYLLYRLTLVAVVRQSRAIGGASTEQSGREDENGEGPEAK